MTKGQNDASEYTLGIAVVIVAVLMIVGAWMYLTVPDPVQVRKEAAETAATAKEQARRDLKEKIDAEEHHRLTLSPAVTKESRETCRLHPDWGMRACEAVAQRQVYVGMSTEQV